jgi:hypothetical protein
MVKLKDNPRLERFLAMLSLAVIAINFVICLIVMEARKKDNSKDETAKKETTKKFADSPGSKKQHAGDGNKKDAVH